MAARSRRTSDPDEEPSGRGQRSGSDPLRTYLREIARLPRHTRQQEADLARRIQAGDEEAFRTLVRANLRFVVTVAKRYHAPGVSLADLINEGNVGLIEAARRFDPDRGTKFVTYAVWWIRQAILHALADSSGAVRLPLKQQQLAFQLGRRYQVMSQRLGRPPAPEELAADMQLDPRVVNDLLRAMRTALPLESPGPDGDGGDHLIAIADVAQAAAPAVLEGLDIIEDLEGLLANLDERERGILRLHYGLDGDPMTLQEIGERHGLTRERIRQIEARAKLKLRRLALGRRLQDHLN